MQSKLYGNGTGTIEVQKIQSPNKNKGTEKYTAAHFRKKSSPNPTVVTAMKETRIRTPGPGLDAMVDKASIAKKNKTRSRSNVSTPNDLK